MGLAELFVPIPMEAFSVQVDLAHHRVPLVMTTAIAIRITAVKHRLRLYPIVVAVGLHARVAMQAGPVREVAVPCRAARMATVT